MSFGKNIKKLRREANMTQEQLAVLLSISPQAVSRWETDVAMPDISLLPAIANTFHVSTDYLLDMDKNHNEAMIEQVIKNPIPLKAGISFKEHFDAVKTMVRNNPANLKLKKTLITLYVLRFGIKKEDQTPEALREFRNLCLNTLSLDIHDDDREEIIGFLATYSGNLTEEESKEIEQLIRKNRIENCYEVLLPLFLSGERRLEANKNLLFESVGYMMRAIYYLYSDFELLTEKEIQKLEKIRHIVDEVYGEGYTMWIIGAEDLIPRMAGYSRSGNYDMALKAAEEIVKAMEDDISSNYEQNPAPLMPKSNHYIRSILDEKAIYDAFLVVRSANVARRAIQEAFPDGVVDAEILEGLLQRLAIIEHRKEDLKKYRSAIEY